MKKPIYSIIEVWGTVRSLLGTTTFSKIKSIVGLAGINMTVLAQLTQSGSKYSTKDALLSAIDDEFGRMDASKQEQFVRIAVEELASMVPYDLDEINDYLRRLGWSFSKGKLLPLSIIDDLDLSIIPPESLTDLTKASQRLRDGDLSGAISSASAIIDSACTEIYMQKHLGNPAQDSFQEKVLKCLSACEVFDKIRNELISRSWSETDARVLVENLKGSMNQAAYVMQKLRSQMGDVHGSKEVYQPLVYSSIKWASIIVSLFPKPFSFV